MLIFPVLGFGSDLGSALALGLFPDLTAARLVIWRAGYDVTTLFLFAKRHFAGVFIFGLVSLTPSPNHSLPHQTTHSLSESVFSDGRLSRTLKFPCNTPRDLGRRSAGPIPYLAQPDFRLPHHPDDMFEPPSRFFITRHAFPHTFTLANPVSSPLRPARASQFYDTDTTDNSSSSPLLPSRRAGWWMPAAVAACLPVQPSAGQVWSLHQTDLRKDAFFEAI